MPVPVISVGQMRDWERATWAAGRTEADVIRRVGHIVTGRARQMTRPGDLILVLAGKGHNGDDARHTSQNLNDREVCLLNVADPQASLKDFQAQLRMQPALIIDGLFGIGLNRELDSDWKKLIEAINGSGIRILSVDTPSGLDANTGEPLGAAIRATVTLTLGAPKKGLLAGPAWPYVGRLEAAPDIGLVANPIESEMQWCLGEDFAAFPPARPAAGHKGDFGHAAIFAGSLGYHGAAVLAARGALRANPGLVTLFCAEEVYVPVASQLQAAMVRPWRPDQILPEKCTAILAGPGLAGSKLSSAWEQEARRLWLQSPLPMVADASALAWLPAGPVKTKAIRVVTPHPGEAARLLRTDTANVQNDRAHAVKSLSKQYGDCWVALKGHHTLTGRSKGKLYANSSGNAMLAQGGSGDVLAGYLAGLLAQPALQANPGLTLRYAVWQHGAAADALSVERKAWVVEELLETLGSAEA